jgi:hypothetical protein
MSETPSQTPSESTPADGHDPEVERQAIAEGQERLDARSDGEGLAAEAGSGEEAGLAEG